MERMSRKSSRSRSPKTPRGSRSGSTSSNVSTSAGSSTGSSFASSSDRSSSRNSATASYGIAPAATSGGGNQSATPSSAAPSPSSASSPSTATPARSVQKSSSIKDSGTQGGAEDDGPGPRGFLFLRSGEEMDWVFPRWTLECQDKYGDYEAKDLNHPNRLPRRRGLAGPTAFEGDAPLTQMGSWEARLIGRALCQALKARAGVDAVYAAPSLAALQTASFVSQSLRPPVAIKVEPGLGEWGGACLRPFVPLTPEEAEEAGIAPFDRAYAPVQSQGEFLRCRGESLAEARQRVADVLLSIRAKERHTRGFVLIVSGPLPLQAAFLGRFGAAALEKEATPAEFPPASILHLCPPPPHLSKYLIAPSPIPNITALALSTANAILSPNSIRA